MQDILFKCAQALGLFAAAFAVAGNASAQVKLTSPTTAELVGANISMTGTGYPTGTIVAASTTVTVTPAPGNGGPLSFAPTVVSGSGTNRTLVFKLPVSLTANLPYTATIAVAGTAGGTAFTTATPATITIEPAASIANVSPGAGQIGTSGT